MAHPARVYDYWLGGENNFPADREAGERVLAATPGLRERVRANVHTWRPDPGDIVPPDGVSAYGGVARKP